MRIVNHAKSTVLADNCKVADRFFSRLLGLMGKKCLPDGEGLLITPCNSIHMFFMKFAIDAVFLDKNNTVVYLSEAISPWKVSKLVLSAHSVLELPSGTIRKSGTCIGDKLTIFLSAE